jgi:hypothetical protein
MAPSARDACVTVASKLSPRMVDALDVRYTLWSRGRLLGETDLGFIFRPNGFRMGWFHPTALGDRLMPIATGVSPALRTLCMIGPDPTAQADVQAAVDQAAALELELHGPDGAVIATEDIGIIDTHYLLELARSVPREDEELSPEEEAAVQEMLEEFADDEDVDLDLVSAEEETEFPRYQIQVHLVDHKSIP